MQHENEDKTMQCSENRSQEPLGCASTSPLDTQTNIYEHASTLRITQLCSGSRNGYMGDYLTSAALACVPHLDLVSNALGRVLTAVLPARSWKKKKKLMAEGRRPT